MTEYMKDRIYRMRLKNATYRGIAQALDLPEATVKTYCRRNHLQDADLRALKTTGQDVLPLVVCAQCGMALEQVEKRKPRRFCSDLCRLAWWNAHRDEVNQKTIRTLNCAACGRNFNSYNGGRKFCSHHCYIKNRFGGDQNDSRADETRAKLSCRDGAG